MEKRGKMKHSFFIEGENERISALLDAQKTFLDDLRRPCEPGREIKKNMKYINN